MIQQVYEEGYTDGLKRRREADLQVLVALTVGLTYIENVARKLDVMKYPDEAKAIAEHLILFKEAINTVKGEKNAK